MISLNLLNNVFSFLGGVVCICVLISPRINTMQPLSMLFVAFSGLTFTFCLLSGLIEPHLLTGWGLLARLMGLLAFTCWVAARWQCEVNVNRRRRGSDWQHR